MLARTPSIAGVICVPSKKEFLAHHDVVACSPDRRPCCDRLVSRTRSLPASSSPSRSEYSTITTASAPGGIGAPVMIRIVSPGPTLPSGAAPAAISPTTVQFNGNGGDVDGPHGISIDSSVVERRHDLGRHDHVSEHQPARLLACHRDRLTRRARFEDEGLGIFQGRHASIVRTPPFAHPLRVAGDT